MLNTVFINIIISENSVFVSGINKAHKAHTHVLLEALTFFGRFQKNSDLF